jgi:hypothetical protein
MPIQTAADSISNSAGSPYGFKNRIINGNMNIDQRYAGSSVSPGSGKLYVVDRWAVQSASASKFTVGQNLNSVGAPNGFTNYLGVSVATTYTPSASDYNYLGQNIEGLNTLDLMWGTSQAKTVSVSFWAYSNLAGLHSGFICGRDFNNAWPYTFTLVANTWTYVTLTIPGPTTGDGSTWFKDNQQGIWVGFNLGMGSNWTGATAGAWNGASLQSTGAVSLVQNAGATLFITGVQFEKGSQATAFDYRPYGTEFAMCQRYFQKNPYLFGAAINTTTLGIGYVYPVIMRASPTKTLLTSTPYAEVPDTTGYTASSASFNNSSAGISGAEFRIAGFSGLTSGRAPMWLAENQLSLSAEL